MQTSLAGKKVSKSLKLGQFRETITESVEIEFTSETDFNFTGTYSYFYNSDNYDGDRETEIGFNGSGTYQVISNIPEKNETFVKLIFSKFIRGENKVQEEVPDVTIFAHIYDIYGNDIYFDDKKFFKNLNEDNLFENIWKKEIDMLVRCDFSKEEAYIRVFDYFQSIADQHIYKYSYSYCVVEDLIYEIFQRSFPDYTNNLSNVKFWFNEYYKGKEVSVQDFCVMWKEAGLNLKSFLEKNNLTAFSDKIRQEVYDLYDDSVPEELKI